MQPPSPTSIQELVERLPDHSAIQELVNLRTGATCFILPHLNSSTNPNVVASISFLLSSAKDLTSIRALTDAASNWKEKPVVFTQLMLALDNIVGVRNDFRIRTLLREEGMVECLQAAVKTIDNIGIFAPRGDANHLYFSPVEMRAKIKDICAYAQELASKTNTLNPLEVKRAKSDGTLVENLIKRLASGDLGQKCSALDRLATLDDTFGFYAVAGSLSDSDCIVRTFAAQALETMGRPEAVPFLESSIKKERDLDARQTMEIALSAIRVKNNLPMTAADMIAKKDLVAANAVKKEASTVQSMNVAPKH